jgi:hypothetical protein
MAVPYITLKQRQRLERAGHPTHLALRVHRALSWLHRAEQCTDSDGRFIFLWIAFNSAYANETGEYRLPEGRRFGEFLNRLVSLDRKELLSNIVWQQYSGAIRILLDNKFVFQPFWDNLNKLPDSDDWEQQFDRAKTASNRALADRNTGRVLCIVFSRLYTLHTLRNQLIHGGATWNSKVNREQLRDGAHILEELVPAVIDIMMDNAQAHWAEACYPVSQ